MKTLSLEIVEEVFLSTERTDPIVEALSRSGEMLETVLAFCNTVDVGVVTSGPSLIIESFLADGCLIVVASGTPSISASAFETVSTVDGISDVLGLAVVLSSPVNSVVEEVMIELSVEGVGLYKEALIGGRVTATIAKYK